ncbi:unnamed protein product [Polarella glacialis]|uniref:Uncharacterized protein n=1 Tax=Polarella glacialis TaxID=89957 RepID=A0A813I5R6_POLGL|nr:unnamed protein product [Polarella glacialis]
MSLAEVLAGGVTAAVAAGKVGDANLWTKVQKAIKQARKSPEEIFQLGEQGIADVMEFLLLVCSEIPSFRKQAVAALLMLLERSPGGLGTFAKASGKSRLQIWKLPVSASSKSASLGDAGAASLGAAELAAQLLASGCDPDELLAPLAEDVASSAEFVRELLKIVGEQASFQASAVGKALLAADLPLEDKPKRQVVGASADFNAKGGKIIQA